MLCCYGVSMNSFHKILVFGVILLFVGIAITPAGSTGFKSYFSVESQVWSYSSRDDNDTTPPVTTIKFDAIPGYNGWYRDSVLVSLYVTDDMSGVNVTYYRIDDGVWNKYSGHFEVLDDGIYMIYFYSVDNAGNVEDVKSAELKIDTESPYVFEDCEKIGKDKWKITAICFENMSGMDRVEFYYWDEYLFTDYEEPYEFIWNGSDCYYIFATAYDKAGNKGTLVRPITPTILRGFIWNPQFTEYSVTFYALVVSSNKEGRIMFESRTYNLILHSGYIGKFFIYATFPYEWPFS